MSAEGLTPAEVVELTEQCEFACGLFREMAHELELAKFKSESVSIPLLSIAVDILLSIAVDIAASSGMKREKIHKMVDAYFDATIARNAGERPVQS